jgi:uncharacterized protein (TIGR02145 family)
MKKQTIYIFLLLGLILIYTSFIKANSQNTVKIGNQTWTTKNLDVSKYRNGDEIPHVNDPLSWSRLTYGAWCYYENVDSNGTTYGKLYNLYAVLDPRGLAPAGFHIPSDKDWTTLTDYLGGKEEAGVKMKEAGSTHWPRPNTGATNSSGFTGLPGGYRDDNGSFFSMGVNGFWWSSTEGFTYFAWNRYPDNLYGLVGRDFGYKSYGMSVRCIAD